MFSSKLKNWPIFSILDPEFISKIRIVVVHGNAGNRALMVTEDNKVYAIGTNTHGCLGTGNTLDTLDPIEVTELCGRHIKTFAFGTDHVLALTTEGQVYSWGNNNYGQLGNGCYEPRLAPGLITIAGGIPIVDIACGASHCLALTQNGQVYSWGGQKRENSSTCKVTQNLSNVYIASITCGIGFNMAITDKGKVYSWGENDVGQLGIGTSSSRNEVPSEVVVLNGIVIEKVVCGCTHTLALSTSGALYVWGGNKYGQLGLGTKTNVSNPTQLVAKQLGRVLNVAASYCSDISVAMGTENRVFVWGKCLEQNIQVPMYSWLKCLHDVFALYSSHCVTHQPLILEKEEEEVASSLTDCFWKAFNDPITSDVTIIIQGKPVHVHKTILKIRCQYLRRKFEECWDTDNQSIIEIEEFSYYVYAGFLQYLYTGNVTLPAKDLIELFHLANTYSEDGLKDLCIFKLNSGITVENVISLYSDSVKYKAKELQKCCLDFALNRIAILLQTPAFHELDARMFKTFVLEAAKAGVFIRT